MAKPTLLLDGDLILYRNAIACEREAKFDDENWILWCNEENAWANIQASIEGFKSRLSADDVILCFSEGRCFRYDLTPTYKASRVGQRKPLGYLALVERAKGAYPYRTFEGVEADDLMGILATKPDSRRRIIVSDDKDMKSIPGLLYRQGELQQINESEADHWHMYQTLIGDTADSYAGLPGCGPKTAEKILGEPVADPEPDNPYAEQLWQAVIDAFVAKGLTEDDALLQARLARICRWSDWDPINRKVILWTPPSQ